MNAFKADVISSRAFKLGGRLCQRCQKRHTVNLRFCCARCLVLERRRVQAEIAAIEERRKASAAPMPLFKNTTEE